VSWAALRQRPRTRLQHARAMTRPTPNEALETDSSSEDELEEIGVTERTASRRLHEYRSFMEFTDNAAQVTTTALRAWIATRPERSQLTAMTTLLGALRRREIAVPPHAAMIVRELKKQHIARCPQRAPVADSQLVHQWREAAPPDLAALLELTWMFAARLTSIINVQLEDIKVSGTQIMVTFRQGKTILSTGAYTLVTQVSQRTIDWLKQLDGPPFPRNAEHYYRRLALIMRPSGHEIKSLRRGALQTASRTEAPEDAMLLSRHTTKQSFYNYLDDGQHATWEHDKLRNMSGLLRHQARSPTPRSRPSSSAGPSATPDLFTFRL
jgi:hypothetical protein